MTLKITHKHSTTAGTSPASGDIDVGEIAINAADAKLYTKDTDGVIRTFPNEKDVVSVKDFGAVGDGVADDTAAIQAAVDAASNGGLLLFENNSTYLVNSEVTCDNVSITQTSAQLTGAGSIRGIIANETLPLSLFGIPFNVELAVNRTPATSGSLYVDPCLGNDSNSGASATLPVRTLAGLKTRLDALIGLGGDAPITVVLRGGRHEITTAIDFDTSQATSTVSFIANPGETPIITGELLWFFRNGATCPNPSEHNVYRLWSFTDEGITEIPVSTTATENGNYILNRNTAQAVTLLGSTLTLVPDADVLVSILSATNLSKCRLRVTQSWTSSIYYTGLTVNGTNLDYTLPLGQGNYYYNGFDAGVSAGYAPYSIEGLDSTRLDHQWCNNGTTISVPSNSNIFITQKALDNHITISANKYSFNGIEFAYFAPTPASQELQYTGTANTAGSTINVTGNNVTFDSCFFRDFEGTAIKCLANGTIVQNCEFNRIGHTAIAGGNDVNPEDTSTYRILNNKFFNWGITCAGGRCVAIGADDVWIKDNFCQGGPPQAIQTQTDTSTSISYQVYRNVVRDCGMIKGRLDERLLISDCGLIYHNGLQNTVDLRLKENVVFNGYGHSEVHGIYLDNGIKGSTVEYNLVFNVPSYALSARDVSGNTVNNTVSRNVFYGQVTFGSSGGSNAYEYNAQIATGSKQNVFGGSVAIVEPFGGKLLPGTTTSDFAEIVSLESLTNDGFDVDNYRGYLRDKIGPIDVYEGTFTPVVIGGTVAGTGTYSKQSGYFKRDGQLLYVSMRLTWSAHTGTGSLKVDLADTGYVSNSQSNMLYVFQVWANNLTFSPDYVVGYITPGTTILELASCTSGTGSAAVAMDTSADISITGSFRIA